MKKSISIFLKITELILLGLFTLILVRSAFDIYNNFAYDKAIIKDSPYGYTPLLNNTDNYTQYERNIMSGEYVYVMDWLSSNNGRIAFAKVKSRLTEGYINKDLLVQTNINIKPIFSVISLVLIFIYFTLKVYRKFQLKTKFI